MKQKHKQIFNVRLFLIAAFLTLISCQKDDNTHITIDDVQNKSTAKIVSAEDIPEVINFIKSKSNSKMEFLLNDSNAVDGMMKNHEENLTITTVIADQIKQVTNSFGKSNYTFKMTKEIGDNEVYFLNLIVKEYKDTFYIYITKYVPDTVWLDTFIDESSFANFSGLVYFYDQDGIYILKIEMTDGMSTNVTRNSCNDGGGGSSDGGTGDTGDSGSDGGGGGDDITCFVTVINITTCGCPPLGIMITFSEVACDDYYKSLSDILRHPCDDGNGTDDPVDDCADQNDCEYGWNDDCSCMTQDEVENGDIAIDISDLVLPCDNLNNLTNNEEIKLRLKQLTASEANFEQGFRVRKNPTTGEDSPDPILINSDASCGQVNFAFRGLTFAAAHSHPTSCNTFGMFSGADIFKLVEMAQSYTGQGNSNHVTYTFIITFGSHVYAIKFDTQESVTLLTNIYNDLDLRDDFNGDLEREYQKLERHFGDVATVFELEEELLKHLKDNNLDISLYKATTDSENFVTSWNRKTLNDINQVDTEPCN